VGTQRALRKRPTWERKTREGSKIRFEKSSKIHKSSETVCTLRERENGQRGCRSDGQRISGCGRTKVKSHPLPQGGGVPLRASQRNRFRESKSERVDQSTTDPPSDSDERRATSQKFKKRERSLAYVDTMAKKVKKKNSSKNSVSRRGRRNDKKKCGDRIWTRKKKNKQSPLGRPQEKAFPQRKRT